MRAALIFAALAALLSGCGSSSQGVTRTVSFEAPSLPDQRLRPLLDGVDSIGDLLTRLAGQIPIAGSVFVWENIRFKVLAADDRHVIRVSVERVEPTIELNGVNE